MKAKYYLHEGQTTVTLYKYYLLKIFAIPIYTMSRMQYIQMETVLFTNDRIIKHITENYL